MKNIVVVGGGTAGWITSLYAQKLFPNSKITLIESDKVDIIGVGESTTPSIIDIFDFIGISISDLILNAGATFKSSIKFTNWNGDGKHYFHGFNSLGNETNFYNFSKYSPYSEQDVSFFPTRSYLAIYELFHGRNLDDIHVSSVMSKYNKVPLIYENKFALQNKHPIHHFSRHAKFALHFNARILVEYLRKIGNERKIKIINDLIIDNVFDEKGFVKELKLESGNTLECDFVFDCTGLSRFFVEKTFKSKFDSYSNHLPVKKAIPFFVENKEKTPPFTEAIAMKYGWIWKIPVEGRFGCGYVFDSDYINSDDAYKEACELFGKELDAPRTISFSPGYFLTPWNKNVLALGLSSGFVEPLEATSIWVICMSLFLFTEHISGAVLKEQEMINQYNKSINENTKSILNLVHTHYLTQRNDSDFWKEFRIKNKMPESLLQIMEKLKYRTPITKDAQVFNVFNEESWFVVGAGNKLFSRDIIEKEYNLYNIEDKLKNKIDSFKSNLDNLAKKCMDHDDLLNYLRQRGNG